MIGSKNIIKKISLIALVAGGAALCFGAVNNSSQDGSQESGSYVSFLPSCEDQGLQEDFTKPNFKSFVEPHSPQLAATAWEYCQIANDIDKKALQHLDSIDANRDKSLVELLNENGDMFCYGAFGECGLSDDTLYQQYIDACQTSFDLAREKLGRSDQDISTDSPFYQAHMDYCKGRAREKLRSFRDIANIQTVQNQVKLMEEHNLKKLAHNHEQLKNASDVEDNAYEMLERAIIALGGFTSEQDENLPSRHNAPRDPINNDYVNNNTKRIQDQDVGQSCPTCGIY